MHIRMEYCNRFQLQEGFASPAPPYPFTCAAALIAPASHENRAKHLLETCAKPAQGRLNAKK